MKLFFSILIASAILLSPFQISVANAQGEEAAKAGTYVLGSGVETAIQQAIKAAAKIPSVPTSDVLVNAKEVQMCFSLFGAGLCFPGLDKLAIMATKQFIERMVDSTVVWINSGFDGNPAYITSPEQYFRDIVDGVAGEFISGSDLGFLCSPFEAQIRLSLQKSYSQSSQFQCTLSEIDQNLDGFFGNFSNGGWETWLNITQEESNNPYGAYLEAKLELDSRVAKALNIKKEQLDWGRGFLSTQSCLKDDSGKEYRDAKGKCTRPGPIVTPGSVIETQLQATLGTGISQLELADEFDELIGALLGQLLEKTVFSAQGLFSAESIENRNPGSTDPTVITPRSPSDFFTGYCTGWDLDCSIFDEAGDKIFYMFTSPTDVIIYPQVTSVQLQGVDDSIHLEINGQEVQVCEADSATYAVGCMFHKNFNTQGGQTISGYAIDTTVLRAGKPDLPTDGSVPSDSNPLPPSTGGAKEEKIISLGSGTITIPGERGTIGVIGGVEVKPGEGDSTPAPGEGPADLLADLNAERSKYPSSFQALCPNHSGLQPDTCPLGAILNAVAWKNKNAGWVLLGKSAGHRCKIPSGREVSCDYLVHQPTMYGYDVFSDAEGSANPQWGSPDTTIRSQVNSGQRTLVPPGTP